ncbi:MAG: nucleotidyltransferase domain-containing protein [Firmicutes bacterium]|nr:nucleotidyltransferase domain-containing protein [Bacillota bacterium]
MDHVSLPVEMGRQLRPIFTQYGVKRAVLFGSYARGTATEKSDIDLLVDSGLHGLRFVSLCEDIRRALGKEVDLFDISHIEKHSRIDREISATGVVIHEK